MENVYDVIEHDVTLCIWQVLQLSAPYVFYREAKEIFYRTKFIYKFTYFILLM